MGTPQHTAPILLTEVSWLAEFCRRQPVGGLHAAQLNPRQLQYGVGTGHRVVAFRSQVGATSSAFEVAIWLVILVHILEVELCSDTRSNSSCHLSAG